MRDHSENKNIPKKCMLLNVSKPRVIIPQENKQNKKNLQKTAKIQKNSFTFNLFSLKLF